MSAPNPCLACGACCAHFRVSFYWTESDPFLGGGVPVELTRQLTPHRAVMQGTDCSKPRCVALEGEIGGQVRCSIYEKRPSPCRELDPAWLHGAPSDKCDTARAAHGLPPLTPDTFNEPNGPGNTPFKRSA
ncbi:MAG TPA: YkgJ family cysteine cluster protein [Gammaproteobacteria bacterium]|nr:YkgJ family cysteine cluster protein [Gammaproteobacteria bacterium]